MTIMTVDLAIATGAGEPNADQVTSNLSVWNYVNSTDAYVPLTGVHSVEQALTGWRWDQRRLESLNIPESRYQTYVGGTIGGLTEGFNLNWWQTGSVDGLDYLQTVERINKLRFNRAWTPQVRTGSYTVNRDSRGLFSDWSTLQNLDTADVTGGVTYADLPVDAVHESLSVALYRRSSVGDIETHRRFEEVADFTGVIVANVRQDTGTIGAFNTANFSDREYEYIVDETNDRIYFNQSAAIEVGDPVSAAPGLISTVGTWEAAGMGSSDGGRTFFLNYFPVLPGSVEVVSIAGDGTMQALTELELAFADTTDLGFEVDYDLGSFRLTGYQAPDLALAADVGLADDKISVLDADLAVLVRYPDQGVITIGTEEIQYYEKTSTGFAQCVRGFNSTTPALHTALDLVEHRQQGVVTQNSIHVKYTAVPRIEYEVSSHTVRTANTGSYLDVQPFSNKDAQAVFQLISRENHLDSIVLEIDRPSIGGNMYGPIQFGSDVARLTARALDPYETPIAGQELTIEINAGLGFLGFEGVTSFTGITNNLGEIYAQFYAPFSASDMDLGVTNVTHVGADTTLTVASISPSIEVSDIWLFQVLKHDPEIGTVGEEVTVITSGTDVRATGMLGWVDVDAVFEDEFKGGLIYIFGTDLIKRSYRVLDLTNSTDASGLIISRLWLDQAPDPAIVNGQPGWAVQREAAEWDSSLKHGKKVILYEHTTDYNHPVTGVPGAYGPVRADAIAGTTLTYLGRHLPVPDATDDSEPLGAYVVVAPSVAEFQAYGEDAFSGNVVYSNLVKLSIEIPPWLSGVDGALSIPHGFKLASISTNVGAGLGGANFLTVNPLATGISQFSLFKPIP